MKTNKNVCLFAIIMLLGISNCAFAEDLTDEKVYSSNNFMQSEEIEDNVKANKATLDKAQEAINNKDFDTAISYMTSYINSKPKRYEGYKLRGDAYYGLRRYDLAQSDYQSAVNIKLADDKLMTNTKYVSAIILGADKTEQLQNTELGNLYARLMYAQKALNNPEYTTSYENAVKYNSHIYLPQPQKADISKINCPQKYGKELNPQGIDSDIYGAISDIENKKYNDALYKLQKVTSTYPQYYLGHYLHGVALVGLDSEKEAIASFEKALSLNPYDFESLASLGQIYYNRAETTFSSVDAKKSTEYFQKALKYNPNCHTYNMYIGLNELLQGNNSQAISAFDKAVKLNENDFNSIYYKSIAQYANEDYNSVINNTTSLLRKHVSNYNSVLYLRALANCKLKEPDKALADLNEIQNNIEDIYNADIKVVSDKEKTLNNYVYYLKAQIQHKQGLGAASDMDKALQNPIIAQLSKAQKALEPYENSLNNSEISKEDFNKFESFYKTSLPKLLQSGITITEDDINNQYDYIRTTFSDLGVTFYYQNPDYKMTTISDYPYKKYASKLSQEDQKNVLSSLPVQTQSQILPIAKSISMRESTPQSELLMRGDNGFVAQLLATNALALQAIPKAEPKESPITSTEEIKEPTEAIKLIPQNPSAEGVKSNNISSGEPLIFTDKKPLLNEENAKSVKEILDIEKTIESNNKTIVEPYKISAKEIKESTTFDIKQEKPEAQNATDALNYITNGNKLTAKEIKETPDITIKTETPNFIKKAEPIVDNVVKTAENGSMIFKAPEEKQTEDIVIKYGDATSAVAKKVNDTVNEITKETPELRPQKEITDKTIKEVQETAKPLENEIKIASKTINKKYADINPEDFGVQTKPTPVFTDFDDIIELDKGSFMQDLEGDPNYATNLEEEINKRLAQQQENLAKAFTDDKTNAITLPEEEITKKVSSIKEDKSVAVPAVVVPELTKPELRKTEEEIIPDNNSEQITLTQKTLEQTIKDSNDKITDYTIKYTPIEKEPDNTIFTKSEKSYNDIKAETKALAKAQKEKLKQDDYDAAISEKEHKKVLKQEAKEAKEQAKLKATIAKAQAKEEAESEKVDAIAAKQKAKEEAKAYREAQKAEKAEEKAMQRAQKKAQKAVNKANKEEISKQRKLAKQQAKELKAELENQEKSEAQIRTEILKAQRADAIEQAKREKAETKAIARAQKAKIKQARAEAKAQAREQAQLEKEAIKTQKAKEKAKADIQKTAEKEAKKIKKEILKTRKVQIASDEKKVSNTTKKKFSWKNLFKRKK